MQKTIPNQEAQLGIVISYRLSLFSQSEFLDQLTITLEVMLAHVSQQTLSFTNHLHQATVGRKIFFVRLQMLRQMANTICQ